MTGLVVRCGHRSEIADPPADVAVVPLDGMAPLPPSRSAALQSAYDTPTRWTRYGHTGGNPMRPPAVGHLYVLRCPVCALAVGRHGVRDDTLAAILVAIRENAPGLIGVGDDDMPVIELDVLVRAARKMR